MASFCNLFKPPKLWVPLVLRETANTRKSALATTSADKFPHIKICGLASFCTSHAKLQKLFWVPLAPGTVET
jgi:hypothetical protein